MKIYKRLKTERGRMREDGTLILYNQQRYLTLDQLVKKFHIDEKMLNPILYPHQDEDWVLYTQDETNKNLTPYYKASEVRTLLVHHGLDITNYRNRKRGSRWEIEDRNGKKSLTRSDLTTIIDGELHGRAQYWANLLELDKARVCQLLDELDDSELKTKILEFKPMSTSMQTQRTRLKRSSRTRYCSKEIIQEVVNRYDSAKTLSDSCPIPEGEKEEEYRTAYAWKSTFQKEKLDMSTSQSLGSHYYNELDQKPSYIKAFNGVKVRVYYKQDATRAMMDAVALTKHNKKKLIETSK